MEAILTMYCMLTVFRRAPVWLLALAALFYACNYDNDKYSVDDTVMGPDLDDVGDEVSLDAAVIAEMNAAVEKAIGLLFVGGGTVPGAGGGQIVVAGSTFAFEEYYPDGVFFLDGQLTMDLLAAPIMVQGNLVFRSAAGEGPIAVDMTIDASTDPVTYGGTVTVNGVPIDLSGLE
jgi:hypothetical protein